VLETGLPEEGLDLEALIGGLERRLVTDALERAGGNQSKAARLLGLNRDKFRYRMKSYGIGEDER